MLCQVANDGIRDDSKWPSLVDHVQSPAPCLLLLTILGMMPFVYPNGNCHVPAQGGC